MNRAPVMNLQQRSPQVPGPGIGDPAASMAGKDRDERIDANDQDHRHAGDCIPHVSPVPHSSIPHAAATGACNWYASAQAVLAVLVLTESQRYKRSIGVHRG